VLDVCRRAGQGPRRRDRAAHLGEFRAGDIRHCYADTRRAEELLGFRAEIAFRGRLCANLLSLARDAGRDDQVDEGAAYRALAGAQGITPLAGGGADITFDAAGVFVS
jgi:dTDP-L-rhamnose 4-epimerase